MTQTEDTKAIRDAVDQIYCILHDDPPPHPSVQRSLQSVLAILEPLDGRIYCPECTACGIAECCPPTMCHDLPVPETTELAGKPKSRCNGLEQYCRYIEEMEKDNEQFWNRLHGIGIERPHELTEQQARWINEFAGPTVNRINRLNESENS